MSGEAAQQGVVAQTVADLLDTVNEGFNWDVIYERYDSQPVGTSMSLHFTDEAGETVIEQVHLGIAEGPRLVVLDEIGDRWDHLGDIVTYQSFGLRILDPDDPMTAEKARYQHGGVSIHPAGGEIKERVWLVTSKVLDVMLETIIHRKEQMGGEE